MAKIAIAFWIVWRLSHQAVFAQEQIVVSQSANTSSKLSLSRIGGEWRLQVVDGSLSQVLESISLKADLIMHYAVLPASRVTATCIGVDVIELLQCLFAGSANIVYRRSESKSAKNEIWIMSSSLVESNRSHATCLGDNLASLNEQPDLSGQWLELAKSSDVEKRAQAVGQLGKLDSIYDTKVRLALNNALSDKHPFVRANAIAALAGLEGEEAVTEQLRIALKDNSPDVRRSALDMIDKDVVLLQLALQDADSSIRDLAKLKLELLE
jgi:hypothetical protein